jgi:hypothetical protein
VLLREPVDFLDAGRVAAARDPTGAIVSLWQPRSHVATALLAAPQGAPFAVLELTETSSSPTFGLTMHPHRLEELESTRAGGLHHAKRAES